MRYEKYLETLCEGNFINLKNTRAYKFIETPKKRANREYRQPKGNGTQQFVETRIRIEFIQMHNLLEITGDDIARLDDADKAEFLAELGLDEPGLDRVIRCSYKLLSLQTFFTANSKEVHAWTTRIGALAPKAAAEIHTDFAKGFIRAEVITYDDFVAGNGEQGAKEAGRLRVEGKDYIVREGDVIYFRFNV